MDMKVIACISMVLLAAVMIVATLTLPVYRVGTVLLEEKVSGYTARVVLGEDVRNRGQHEVVVAYEIEMPGKIAAAEPPGKSSLAWKIRYVEDTGETKTALVEAGHAYCPRGMYKGWSWESDSLVTPRFVERSPQH